jgi:ubiquinone/menaquinone biosynthesis C-methylase UbiE
LRPRDFYEKRHLERGPMRDYHYVEFPPAVRLFKTVNLIGKWVEEDIRLLDVGCGDATVISCLKRGNLFGLDISHNILEMATDDPRLRLIQAYSEKMPFRRSVFDVVVCLEVLEHVEDPKSVLREIRRIVKPGGRVLISIPVASYWRIINFRLRGRPETYLDELEHITEYSRIRLKRFTSVKRFLTQIESAGFIVVSVSGCYFIPDFLDRFIVAQVKRFPLMARIYNLVDIAFGYFPLLRYVGRYLFISCKVAR